LLNRDDGEDDVSGVLLGKENYLEPAIITGFISEIWIYYKDLEVFSYS
jgi:hypothetical protein